MSKGKQKINVCDTHCVFLPMSGANNCVCQLTEDKMTK